MIKNYGFVLGKDDPKAYKLGAVELPKDILRPDGQWDAFLPDTERQDVPYETWGCTIYGTENVQQILEKFHFGTTQEYSERYNYNLIKINPPGADPHDAAESFRNDGVVPLLDLPIPNTYEKYATPRPVPDKLVNIGIRHPYELKHQWLWRREVSRETRTRLIKEYLQYSPLCVSVTAWQEDNGVYIDNGMPNTHWTVLYGWDDKGWKIFDSYAPHRKTLSYGHHIEACKRYQLVLSTRLTRMTVMQRLKSLLEKLIEALKELIRLKTPPSVPEIPKDIDKDYITPLAKAIEDFEGYAAPGEKDRTGKIWPEGTPSWRRRNPGNIKHKNGEFIVFDTYEEGFNYLKDYLRRACMGLHDAYNPNMSIREFVGVYAPDGEPIETNYTNFICTHMSKAMKEQIFPSKKLHELL